MLWLNVSYNPLERREPSKGGKDVSRKCAPSQASHKPAGVAPRTHNARKTEAHHTSVANQTAKVSKAAAKVEPEYEKQVKTVISVVLIFFLKCDKLS